VIRAGRIGTCASSTNVPEGEQDKNQPAALLGRSVDDPGPPLLEADRVNKSFGPVKVLHDVEFRVYPGKITALIGDNGAGKSTLVKCLAGIHSTDSGVIRFDGEEVSIDDPKAATALGIKVVYQDLALCENLDIVQNMFLGRELTKRSMLDEHAMEQAARDTLASLSVRTVQSVRQQVSSLSGGQRQTVAIAKAVLGKAKLVILDEPTAALGVAQTEQVLDLVKRLAASGVAVVIISHNMNDVLQVADRVSAMYLGRIAADLPNDDTMTRESLVQLITSGSAGDIELTEGVDE